MKRSTKSTKPTKSRVRSPKTSPKAADVARLIDAMGDGLGEHHIAMLGRRITALMTDAYTERRRSVPRWLQQLVAHYARRDGHA